MNRPLLLAPLFRLCTPMGVEESIKILHGEILTDRVLAGVDVRQLRPSDLWDLAAEWGMPTDARAPLEAGLSRANAVFIGLEPHADGCICKIYLEFWDSVCDQVRQTRARTPLLLHLGVKWDRADPGHHVVTRYTCFPMLNANEVLQRIAEIYSGMPRPHVGPWVREMVLRSLLRHPQAVLLYSEASEAGNPRRSFDVNLYRTDTLMEELADPLRQAAQHFSLHPDALAPFMQRHREHAVGHICGGMDRRGREFMSLYAECPNPTAAPSIRHNIGA